MSTEGRSLPRASVLDTPPGGGGRLAPFVLGAILVIGLVLAFLVGFQIEQWADQVRSRASAPVQAQRDAAPAAAPWLDDAAPVPLPTPAVPLPDRVLANSGLSGAPVAAFGAEDYPASALRAGEEGRVVARLSIGANGVPTRCAIEKSSGSRALDRGTCAIALARIRM